MESSVLDLTSFLDCERLHQSAHQSDIFCSLNLVESPFNVDDEWKRASSDYVGLIEDLQSLAYARETTCYKVLEWGSSGRPSNCQAVERAREYQVIRANEAEFEVVSQHEGANIVDIRNRCCLCRGWQLYGLPCAHGVAALFSCRQNVNRYAESCFTVTTYRKTYSETIHPIPDKSLWKELSSSAGNQEKGDRVETVIYPPKSLRPMGKPRKKRMRSEERGRARRVVHCSRCNQIGHLRTTCAAPI
ncbi:uncharacterized protein A4U43_C07F25710 [Asparagus officinalis]|uniref:SWIM-type domain-containing protein n=1 Tax=Asparagus officinalis TaxID=4686 RepID=A0A5P1EK43_ASPOF|nr:uncharacterized protein A4U43_C07F25710 [Asparagus officinalis]